MLQLGASETASIYRQMHALKASPHVNVVKDLSQEDMLMPEPYDGADNWEQIMASTEV